MKQILSEWKKSKALTKEGLSLLKKEVTMAIPGPCFPAFNPDYNTGIGSPYGEGADAFYDFWDGVVHKILLGPSGRTFPPLFSPYESTLSENPFFIPLEKWVGKLLSKETLLKIYEEPKKDTQINFPIVSRAYHFALKEMYETFLQKKQQNDTYAQELQTKIDDFIRLFPPVQMEAKYYAPFDKNRYFFESYLAYSAALNAPKKIPTIGDLQVKIPDAIVLERPDLFLKNFTLGAPPDAYSDHNQDWFFKIFAPQFIFNPDGSLGEAGKILYQMFDALCKAHKGGVRIDHFIGFVNPFVIPRKRGLQAGRLYSSSENSYLKKYQKKDIAEFANITQKIILKALADNKMTVDNLYPEDLGSRPEQIDAVMDLCKLGRMIVAQFVDIYNPEHPYQFYNARPQDIAVLDTHDMPSIYYFFEAMNDTDRQQHAHTLANYLRFYYTDALALPNNLVRMKWAELLACPANRVQAFFTSFTGQKGRYNSPENPKKWRLRCACDFEILYFKNLVQGRAFNPLDAIALAIFAKGDSFYAEHKDFVDALRTQENALFLAIQERFSEK